MIALAPARRQALDRIQRTALAVGIVAGLVCALGAFFMPGAFFPAYLAAFLFFLGIPLGCMVFLMVYHLTGGAWGFLIRRILEAGMRTLPLFVLLFAPIVLGMPYLFRWALPDVVASTPELQHKQIYLNTPFFLIRAVLYFVIWMLLMVFLDKWSRDQDRTGDPALVRKLGRLSAGGLVLYGITITFASVDWLMSLQPGFRSTIFGPMFASGQLLSALAIALVVLSWLVWRSPLSEFASLDALNDLGNLLFTFLVVWAYLNFFQYMLIWIANLPYDITWFLPRLRDGWEYVAGAVVALEFVVPFFALLLRDAKRRPAALGMVAAIILALHLAYHFWQVLPAFPETPLVGHWLDFVALLAVGGFWLAFFVWQLKCEPLLPRHDENLHSALHLRERQLEELGREAVPNAL